MTTVWGETGPTFLLQPSLHSVQEPKEYPFWSPLLVETNSIGIQTKLNQWKYDIERKTSFEAWTNSPKKMWIWCAFSREKVFPWIISCWQETLGRTSYRMPLTAMWPCCWRGMGVREVTEKSEVIWHFLHFRMNIGTEKSVPQKEKEHLFFQQIQRVPFWFSVVCVLMYRSRSLCLLIRRAVSKMYCFAFKHRFGDIPTTETIHCKTWMNFSHGS